MVNPCEPANLMLILGTLEAYQYKLYFGLQRINRCVMKLIINHVGGVVDK